MNKNKRFATYTITVDNAQRTPDDGSAPILLYDGLKDIYYRTTIKQILMVALKESREFLSAMESRMNDFETSMERKQNEFIADMVKSNETIINLVKAGNK